MKFALVTEWMQLETIISSEISQSPKDRYSLICGEQYIEYKKKKKYMGEMDIVRFVIYNPYLYLGTVVFLFTTC